MTFFPRLRCFILFALLLIAAGGRVAGQSLDYSVTSSVTSVQVSNAVTFSINITNPPDGVPVADLVVTDSVPAWVYIDSYNANQSLGTQVSSSLVTFSLESFQVLDYLQVTVTVIPTQAGSFTNTVTISTPSLTNNSETNLVINVTNTVTIANLGVTNSPAAQTVIVGDSATYSITVTNAGPDTAPAVLLTNTLPPGAIVQSVSPTNAVTLGNNLIFNLGPLASGGSAMVNITVEPTNSGVLTFTSSVGSTSVTNVSTLPTAATNSLTALAPNLGVLTVVTNSLATNNLQAGLEEQSILVSNISATNVVTAARVVVSGISPKELFNAVGTNGGNPFVTYVAPAATPLTNGQSVTLLLQYFPHGPVTNAQFQLQAYPVPVPDLTPPAAIAASSNFKLTGLFNLADGNVLLEFPATSGQTYTVVYSDNLQFSNAMIAPPAIKATANYVQWIDYGPPTTISAPINTSMRFYRVIQNP